MQDFAKGVITAAALTAGLPDADRVMDQSTDNLTIERPRLELQFLPERYTRTGRILAADRTAIALTQKKELYAVTLDVAANILADDRDWLDDFRYRFVAALPGGANDERGNWVRIRVKQARFGKSPDKRVGDAVIKVFSRVNQLYQITFNWRVTVTEETGLIPHITINTPQTSY